MKTLTFIISLLLISSCGSNKAKKFINGELTPESIESNFIKDTNEEQYFALTKEIGKEAASLVYLAHLEMQIKMLIEKLYSNSGNSPLLDPNLDLQQTDELDALSLELMGLMSELYKYQLEFSQAIDFLNTNSSLSLIANETTTDKIVKKIDGKVPGFEFANLIRKSVRGALLNIENAYITLNDEQKTAFFNDAVRDINNGSKVYGKTRQEFEARLGSGALNDRARDLYSTSKINAAMGVVLQEKGTNSLKYSFKVGGKLLEKGIDLAYSSATKLGKFGKGLDKAKKWSEKLKKQKSTWDKFTKSTAEVSSSIKSAFNSLFSSSNTKNKNILSAAELKDITDNINITDHDIKMATILEGSENKGNGIIQISNNKAGSFVISKDKNGKSLIMITVSDTKDTSIATIPGTVQIITVTSVNGKTIISETQTVTAIAGIVVNAEFKYINDDAPSSDSDFLCIVSNIFETPSDPITMCYNPGGSGGSITESQAIQACKSTAAASTSSIIKGSLCALDYKPGIPYAMLCTEQITGFEQESYYYGNKNNESLQAFSKSPSQICE